MARKSSHAGQNIYGYWGWAEIRHMLARTFWIIEDGQEIVTCWAEHVELLIMGRNLSHARQELVKARLLGLGRKFFFSSEKVYFYYLLARFVFFFSNLVHFSTILVHFWEIFFEHPRGGGDDDGRIFWGGPVSISNAPRKKYDVSGYPSLRRPVISHTSMPLDIQPKPSDMQLIIRHTTALKNIFIYCVIPITRMK